MFKAFKKNSSLVLKRECIYDCTCKNTSKKEFMLSLR